MDSYIDIRILPDPEFSTAQLLNALFSKLHRCLVKLMSNDIAISFPDANPDVPGLGAMMRIHGTEARLTDLIAEPWLQGMRDHVRIAPIQEVPANVTHRKILRVQSKSNPERIRRRQIKRHGWTEAQARERVPDSAARLLRLPFLQLRSASSQRQFRLFIDQRVASMPVLGTFNAYGLSGTATVPWF